MRSIKFYEEYARKHIEANNNMTIDEFEKLLDTFRKSTDGMYEAIIKAFYFGVAVGIKQEKGGE